ncbi:MAG TPA: chondroitinase-B domain-containing protein [Dongiaceae bacterium]|nr:chondroitinase-B domain-containing protein [Dongiaceae bacterium]
MSPKYSARVVLRGVLVASLFWSGLGRPGLAQTGGATGSRGYYLDSEHGADGNPGTQAAPWKTLKNLEGRSFAPGDGIYFARGSSFRGGFVMLSSGSPEQPITVTAYGAGSAPKFSNPNYDVLNGNAIRVDGSYIVIDGLYFSDGATGPAGNDQTGESASHKVGAIFISTKATHNIVRNCEITRWPMPIHVYGQYNLITHNYVHDLMNLPARGWWGVGIMIANSNNQISYNRILNCRQLSGEYGFDGGAIELDDRDYPKDNIAIDHNFASDNQGFLEIVEGSASVKNLLIVYNVSNDYQQFLRLSSTEIEHARVENNTVIFTRKSVLPPAVFDLNWFAPDIGPGSPCGTRRTSEILTYRNNIFYLGENYPVSPYCDFPHDHNIYYRPRDRAIRGWAILGANAELGEGDRIADPKFVNMAGGDFHLQPDSPAIRAGVNLGYSKDIEDNPVPASSPDIGAYQH